MVANRKLVFFGRLLAERHNDLMVASESLILELAGDGKEQKK
jgi:hypothetical protein